MKARGTSKLAPTGSTYKLIDLVGTSTVNYEQAIAKAIHDASETLEGLGWFEVVELRGRIDGDRIAEYQATVRIGFRVQPRK